MRDGNHECAQAIEESMSGTGELDEGVASARRASVHPHAIRAAQSRRTSFSRLVHEQAAKGEPQKPRRGVKFSITA